MITIEAIELHWRAAGRSWSILLDEEGPHVCDGGACGPSRPVPDGRARRGRLWTEEEEAVLRAGFSEGKAPAELAGVHGRSEGAIRARLVRMGLMDEEEAALRWPVERSSPPPVSVEE